ncbi:Protein kinase-like domain superfamily [Sesbania bispinosa]|nr:Protein kinase-like domain superfamily [Sesbania bispinosa]
MLLCCFSELNFTWVPRVLKMRALSKMRALLIVCLFSLLLVAVAAVNPSLNDDVLGLIVFKADIQDPKGKLASWNEDDESACGGSWVGVKCNPRSNRVVELTLDGGISPNIARIDNLRVLDLSDNNLSGEVPDDFFKQCGSLRTVSLARNKFSGSVPPGVWTLSGLRSLDLSANMLEGEIPKGVEALKNLRSISLARNRFSGKIPDGFGSCLLLRSIDFSENAFSGSIPGDLKELPEFNVRRPSIVDFQVRFGTINRMSGSVKSPLYSLAETAVQSLQVLDLSHNAFSGEITSAIAAKRKHTLGNRRSSSLKVLKLEHNFLAGKIPTSIENCSSLTTLILSQNRLSGWIPAAVAKLANLQIVDLSFNNLTGALPKQLANLPNLLSFNLSHNNLQGELPAGGFFNTISPSSVSGNPLLCGSAVNKSCPAVLPKPIVLNPNTTTDSGSGSLPPTLGHKRIILSISALIAIGAAAVIVIGVIGITVLNLRVRSSTARSAAALTFSAGDEFSHSPTTDANSGKLVMFSGEPDFSSGAHALLNKDCELGRGGPQKILKGSEELGKVRHQNLVELEGYYWTSSLQLLIYDKGLGLTCTTPTSFTTTLSQPMSFLIAMSALGYMAPEFACKTVKITEKCDVYGFWSIGFGDCYRKRPVEYMEDDVVVLCDMVRGALEEGRVEECVDERLQGKFPAEEAIPVMKLGLICTSQVPSNRPDMGEVVTFWS